MSDITLWPAFPVQGTIHAGMSLRDYFAAKAMQGFCANIESGDDAEVIPSFSYAMADAMLKERQQ